jgi:hypothetical protein
MRVPLVLRTGAELDYATRHSEPEVMMDAGSVTAVHGHDGVKKVIARRRAPWRAPDMPWS